VILKRYLFVYPVVLLFSFFGFYLLESYFTIPPDVISGNGNPGMFIVIAFLPFFIVGYVLSYLVAKNDLAPYLNISTRLILSMLLFISCLFLLNAIIKDAKELFFALGGTPENPESKIYRFGWFNQYTNSVFFNMYTFLLTHKLTIIFGLFTSYLKSQYDEK